VDAAIAAFASRQAGNITTDQLKQAGLDRGGVARRVKNGSLHPRHRGVFMVGHEADPPHAREWGAVLAGGDGAVVSHLSAIYLFELLEPSPQPEIDISVPSRSRRRHDGIRIHRPRALLPSDTGTWEGVPVTSPARTMLDFATAAATARELERAFHEALAQGLLKATDVRDVLRRNPGHHGAALLGPLLADDRELLLTRSEAEELMLALIRSARLPRPSVNAKVHGYEVDFYWRDQHVIVEMDSGRWHGTPAALERDSRKNLHLRSKGFEVLRYTYKQIQRDRDAVIAEIAAKLARNA
jgi:very-short-patch-repair endonuclease